MRLNGLGTILIILALLFISVGDRILPQPLNTYSRNTRTPIERFLVGLFPNREIQRPSQRREDALQQFEHSAEPSSK